MQDTTKSTYDMKVMQDTKKYTYNEHVPRNKLQKNSEVKNDMSQNLLVIYSS